MTHVLPWPIIAVIRRIVNMISVLILVGDLKKKKKIHVTHVSVM